MGIIRGGIRTDQEVSSTSSPTFVSLILAGANGLYVNPGSDIDADLITVGVTGIPKLWWDEATDSFEMNKSLTLPGSSLKIGTVIVTDSDGCLTTNEFHAHGTGGIGGYLKLGQGTTPQTHKEAVHSILWVDSSEKLYFEKADGTDLEIGFVADFIKKDGSVVLTSDWDIGDTRKILADEIRARDAAGLKLYDDGGNGIFIEDGGQVGIGTTTPKQTFDFEGNKVRTQRYLDEDTNTNLGYGSFAGGNLSHTGGGDNGWFNTAVGYNGLKGVTTGYGNVAVGHVSMEDNTTGYENTAIGKSAMHLNISGYQNVAVGRSALYSNTSGQENVAMGRSALYANTNGDYSVAVGRSALRYSTGSNNIAVGHKAGDNITTGTDNIIIGYDINAPSATGSNQLNIGNTIYGDLSTGRVGIGTTAPNFKLELAGTSLVTDRKIGINSTQMVYLPDQTDFTASLFIGNGGQSLEHVAGNDGQYNTAVGIDALKVNTRGNMNIAVGSYVLDSNTTGSFNIAMGYSSMQANVTGSYNTAYGFRTLMNNTGSNNVAIGNWALYSNVANTRSTAVGYDAMKYADSRTSGRETSNTAIGYEALRGNTTASQNTGRFNTGIGDSALRVIKEGQYNTAIGYQALVACSNGSYNVGLGTLTLNNLTTGTKNTAIGYGAVTGSALTNATSIGYATTANASNKVRIGDNNVTVYESMVAWTRPSDRRLKKNIKDSSLGLDFILKLKPKTFNFKKGHEGIEYTGLIAQEVEESLDSLDTDFDGLLRPHNKDAVYSLRYSTFTMPLINAIQEQQKQIEELIVRIAAL